MERKIISISGTHCTGKTTLIKALKRRLSRKDVNFVDLSSKGLSRFGLKINEGGDFKSQLYFFCRKFMNYIEICATDDRHIIFDRSLIDTHIYSTYLFEQKCLTREEIRGLDNIMKISNEIVKFNKVYILQPSFELVQENDRSMSNDFQLHMNNLFIEFYKRNRARGNIVELMPPDTKDRIKIIREYLNL